ncbi:MAG: DUF4349 domain-containing protein, partial [Ornithinibacter sp.]
MRSQATPDLSTRHSRRHQRPRLLVAALLAGVLAVAAVSSCSAADDSADAGAASDLSQSDARAPEAVDGGDVAQAPADESEQAPSDAVVTLADRKLSRRADISLTVDDVPMSAAMVRGVAATQQGVVVAEEVSTQPDTPEGDGIAYGMITISVPADRLDAALDDVAKIGEVASRSTSTDDVTAQYVDTESRVASMKASVDRVRALMTQAEKLTDIVALEAELSRRQADLEAYETQLAALQDSVALAPITVHLATSEDALPADDDTGFLAGLAAGWSAFTGSVTMLLTVLGALLPFAVALSLVLVPLALWL